MHHVLRYEPAFLDLHTAFMQPTFVGVRRMEAIRQFTQRGYVAPARADCDVLESGYDFRHVSLAAHLRDKPAHRPQGASDAADCCALVRYPVQGCIGEDDGEFGREW